MVIEFVDDEADDGNGWDEVESMLEKWVQENGLTFLQKQSLIPVRDFIFDRTTEGQIATPRVVADPTGETP
jgi:hypothetical protein